MIFFSEWKYKKNKVQKKLYSTNTFFLRGHITSQNDTLVTSGGKGGGVWRSPCNLFGYSHPHIIRPGSCFFWRSRADPSGRKHWIFRIFFLSNNVEECLLQWVWQRKLNNVTFDCDRVYFWFLGSAKKCNRVLYLRSFTGSSYVGVGVHLSKSRYNL